MAKTSRNSDGGTVGTSLNTNPCIMRLQGNRLEIVHLQMDHLLDVAGGSDKVQQALLLQRMRHWLNHVFDGCIALPINREYDNGWADNLQNTVMFSPDEPNDFLLQVLVHAKLNAIGKGLVTVASSHVTSDLGNGFGMWFDGDPDELLPSQREWMGEPSYFHKPWWHRSDASVMDVLVPDGGDPSLRPNILLSWDALMPPRAQVDDGKGADIIRPNFRPRIITND